MVVIIPPPPLLRLIAIRVAAVFHLFLFLLLFVVVFCDGGILELLRVSFEDRKTRNYNFLKLCHTECGGDMLVSKSSFEPRGTGSRRSTTPSHGNMRLRPSSTETWKRVLLVPPTKILFLLFTELGYFRVLYASYYALLCFLCKLFSALEKKNRKKKEELSLLSESNSPRFALSIRRRR